MVRVLGRLLAGLHDQARLWRVLAECLDSVVIDGVRVQSPKALLAFYRRLDREKDQRWIRILSSIVEMEKEIWGLNGDESEIDLF